MGFQKGIRFGYRRPRGPGRNHPPYRMSLTAMQARRQNLSNWTRRRTYEETQRIRIEIALATHQPGESYRQMARRLRCSHVHCWKVARRYRRGLIPLPESEQELLAIREMLYPAPVAILPPDPSPSVEPPAYVIPEKYRDLEKWKEQYYAARPWLRKLRRRAPPSDFAPRANRRDIQLRVIHNRHALCHVLEELRPARIPLVRIAF
jgi:hypothetical protein